MYVEVKMTFLTILKHKLKICATPTWANVLRWREYYFGHFAITSLPLVFLVTIPCLVAILMSMVTDVIFNIG